MIIKEIILLTNKLNEQKKFYSEILELEITEETSHSFSVKTKSSLLTFRVTTEFLNPFYHFAFNIPQNQLTQAKQWISQRLNLISLDGEDEFTFESWNADAIYFYDPSGNIIEFIARHNLQNSSDEKFSSGSLLSISEIGLPVKDVKNFYDLVYALFKIPLFSGDRKSFCAAGTNEGLFIIVPEGRKWFPDCGIAAIFPAEVKIVSEDNYPKKLSESFYNVISIKD